jgi:hypothetical protein
MQLVALLPLNDAGAEFLPILGVPAFACMLDKFPELMAAALSNQDVEQWAAKEELVLRNRDMNNKLAEFHYQTYLEQRHSTVYKNIGRP